MKKKISLPIVIAIVFIVSAIVFSVAYVSATKSMNKKLKDLGEKQSLFSSLADVDRFVRENSFYSVAEDELQESAIYGYVEAYDGRVLIMTAEEFSESIYNADGYKIMTISDGCVLVVLTEEQYESLNAETIDPSQTEALTEDYSEE